MYVISKPAKVNTGHSIQQQQQQQTHVLTQIIYKAMIHEYTEYQISKIE